MEETVEVCLVGVTHLAGDKTEALAPDRLMEALWLPSLEIVFLPGRPLEARHSHPESESRSPATAGCGRALFSEVPRIAVVGAGDTGR